MSLYYRIDYNAYGMGWAEDTQEESFKDSIERIKWRKEDYDEGDVEFRVFQTQEKLVHKE